MSTLDLTAIHKHSSQHRGKVLASSHCGCFYCLAIFPPAKIVEWVDEEEKTEIGQTAICPKCGIDAVLPEVSEYQLTSEVLTAMNNRWFGSKSQERRAV